MVIHIANCKGYKKISLLYCAIKHASKENAWIAVGDKETALLTWLMAKEMEVNIPYPIIQREMRFQHEGKSKKAKDRSD